MIKKEHYFIEDKNYDAAVFCFYANNSFPPKSWIDILKNCLEFINLPKKLFNLTKSISNKINRNYNFKKL